MRAALTDQRGMSMIIVLAATIILTALGASLVGLMHTDITHASIQHASAASFFNAQAGLSEAVAQVFAAADPIGYTNPSGAVGESRSYGQGGTFTYWVDTGPAAGNPCGPGLKTIEALGEVPFLGRMINSRVRACGVPGAPFLAALFGVSLVEAQGSTSRTYVAPHLVGSPGAPRGGNIGSFTELNFVDSGLRLNALSETGVDTVTLRDGTFDDYQLFGFTTRPVYETNPSVNPTPWIISVFGDIVKGQPTTGPIPNDCGTLYACVTVRNSNVDVMNIAALRDTENVRHAYMNAMVQQVLPPLSFDPATFRTAAAGNSGNNLINQRAGLPVTGSVYSPTQFDQLMSYMAAGCLSGPTPCILRGTVFVDGTYRFSRNVNLGGTAGDVTLAVQGDLILNPHVSVIVRHDLTTVLGRQTPGVLVFGLSVPSQRSSNVCSGEQANGSGRLILCGGSSQRLTVDGMVYTVDGMSISPQATVDSIGAMYHSNRFPRNPSFSNQNATVVIRFDPLALRAVGRGISIVSWQQLK